ncbi:MAG: hypothetical protein KKB50_04575 [Planctomycetes bacterium]|nr:hypothetical protein [Planctomycetota bacterium]
MGPWTYFAPFWLGTLVAAALYGSSYEQLPPLSKAGYVLAGGLGCPVLGVICQVVMVATQGAFAQVLPVPWGRTIRGGGAVFTGALLLVGVLLGVVAGLLWMEELFTATMVIGVIGVLAVAAAVLGYIWNIPAAVRDFGVRDFTAGE